MYTATLINGQTVTVDDDNFALFKKGLNFKDTDGCVINIDSVEIVCKSDGGGDDVVRNIIYQNDSVSYTGGSLPIINSQGNQHNYLPEGNAVVVWNGTRYEVERKVFVGGYYYGAINSNNQPVYTDYPFFVYESQPGLNLMAESSGTYSIEIFTEEAE